MSPAKTGLTPTEQAPASTAATVDLDGRTVTDLWRDLLKHETFRDALVRALRAVAVDRTVPELYDVLEERDVPVWLHSRIRSVALGDRREAWHLAADVLPGLGRDVGTVADLHAVASLVDALEETGTATYADWWFAGVKRGGEEELTAEENHLLEDPERYLSDEAWATMRGVIEYFESLEGSR